MIRLEAAAIALSAVAQFAFAFYDSVNFTNAPLYIGLSVVATIMALYTPAKARPLSSFLYLLLELCLLCAVSCSGIFKVLPLVFFFVAIKASFLLSKRFLIAYIICIFTFTWLSHDLFAQQFGFLEHYASVTAAARNIANIELRLLFLAGMVTGVYLCQAIVNEQNSREKAEKLAHDVESLARELERQRIARDIHDSLGHTLTALNIHLQVVERSQALTSEQLDQSPQPALAASISAARRLAKQALEDVRKAVHEVRQTDFDLDQALHKLIDEVGQQDSLNAQLSISVPAVSSELAHALYSIVQECLTNVLKHAGASHVAVSIQGVDGAIAIEVQDDGKGFDPAAQSTGYGIKGLQERVAALGGGFEIQTGNSFGTCVKVNIPV